MARQAAKKVQKQVAKQVASKAATKPAKVKAAAKAKPAKAKPAKAKPAKAKPAKVKPAKATPTTAPAAAPMRYARAATVPASPTALAKARATPKAAPKPLSPEFQQVFDALGANPGITRPRMFGSNGLAIGGKYFAIDWRGNLVVKLPKDDVDALVGQGVGVHFDPGMGRPMKEWLQVAPGATDWIALAERALGFVGSQAVEN